MSKLRTRKSRGLTLLELVVVLAIVAALAGLVLPLAATYLEKAHAGAAVDNFKEVSKVVQQYNALKRVFPDNLDSLLEAPTTLYGAVPAASVLTAAAPTADEAAALAAIGITNVLLHDPAAESATFGSTDGTGQPVATGIATITDPTAAGSNVAELFGIVAIPANSTYAVFGLGQLSDLVTGGFIQEAPYHFPEEGNPNQRYERWGLVFEIVDEDGAPATDDASARFVGVVSFHEGELVGVREPLAEFFE